MAFFFLGLMLGVAGMGIACGLVMLRIQGPAQRDVTAKTSIPATPAPSETAQATAGDKSSGAPAWAVKLAGELEQQERLDRKERLSKFYVSQALDRLARNEDPGTLVTFIDPMLDADKMKTGDVGTFALVRVQQIIDGDTFLAVVDDEKTVMVVGMSTADLVDGREFRGRQLAFEVLGPLSYQTVLGAKKTVIAVRQIDVTAARELALEKVREEWKRITSR